jgi:hypothetical protein
MEIIDAIKRKWIDDLEKSTGGRNSTDTSNPKAVLNRAKYMTNPAVKQEPVNVTTLNPTIEETAAKDTVPEHSEDEFEDEFGDAEIVHTTQVGKRVHEAQTSALKAESYLPEQQPLRRTLAKKQREIINPESLDDSLDDPDYDNIPEPSSCDIRVFGQTEVCESVVGPRRSDSRWIITVLNGILKTQGGDEFIFRTSKHTMQHLHQHQ